MILFLVSALSSGKVDRPEVMMCTADGKKYPLNQAFSFTVGCYRYNCECRKDGSWECPGHRVENTCQSLRGRNTGQGRVVNFVNPPKVCLNLYIL